MIGLKTKDQRALKLSFFFFPLAHNIEITPTNIGNVSDLQVLTNSGKYPAVQVLSLAAADARSHVRLHAQEHQTHILPVEPMEGDLAN
jgi:hypothetical protein